MRIVLARSVQPLQGWFHFGVPTQGSPAQAGQPWALAVKPRRGMCIFISPLSCLSWFAPRPAFNAPAAIPNLSLFRRLISRSEMTTFLGFQSKIPAMRSLRAGNTNGANKKPVEEADAGARAHRLRRASASTPRRASARKRYSHSAEDRSCRWLENRAADAVDVLYLQL